MSRSAALQKIQFAAVNYSRLQGLRSIPIGLLVLIVCVWGNRTVHPPMMGLILWIAAAISAGLYWVIDRYYKRTFGRVIQSHAERLVDWVTGIGGVIAGLAAFWLDTGYTLPFSALGLVFAAAILVDYLRPMLFVRMWYAPVTPVFAVLIALASILPLLGYGEWWHTIGIRSEILAVLIAAGLVIIIYGALMHIYFTRLLSHSTPVSEV